MCPLPTHCINSPFTRLHRLHVSLQTHTANISSSVHFLYLFHLFPAGESGYYAEAAFGDGHRAPAPVRLQLAAERVLGRGGRPRHHEQPVGGDQRGQIGGNRRESFRLRGRDEEGRTNLTPWAALARRRSGWCTRLKS